MKIKLALIVTAILFSNISASARIFETKEELIKRYGQPTLENKTQGVIGYQFSKSGYTVMCVMVNGKCAIIGYHKEIGEMSPSVIAILLKNISTDYWKLDKGIGKDTYTCNDGKFAAYYDKLTDTLTILSLEAREAIIEAGRKDAINEAEGL